jgi:Leucine Rich repeat
MPPETASRAATRDPYLEIDIASKELTDQGLALFIDDLIACLEFRDSDHPQGIGRLTEFHLQNNALTTHSLKKLSRIIALSAGDLRELDLSGNEIRIVTPEQRLSWQQFLESFNTCYMLKKLDFSHNPLGPRGIEILARVYMRSELDFPEVDRGDNVAENAPQEGLRSSFTAMRIKSNQENERPLGRASDGLYNKSRPLHPSKSMCLISDV